MKSEALQEMVKKIFGDEKLKAEFIASPESVISRFNLTKEEIRAVLSVHKMGETGSMVNKMGWASPSPDIKIMSKMGWASPAPKVNITTKMGWASPTP